MKTIKKVAVTELETITGSIVDGTNIDDKVHNTYSANTIDGLLRGEEYLIGYILFTKKDNMVYVNMFNSLISDDISNIINVTLPEKFRPKADTGIVGVYTSTTWANTLGRLDIKTTGAISVRKLKTGDYGTTEDATNGYISVNGSYVAKD